MDGAVRYQRQFRLVVWGVLAEGEEESLNPFSITGKKDPVLYGRLVGVGH